MLEISDVIKDIRKSQSEKYHRGKSWEHCYEFFRNYKKFRNNNNFLDHAALHLGFFLASWGMFRGSSFLLQQDYKFFIPIVRILIQPKYDKLWNVDWLRLDKEEDNINLLFQLRDHLKSEITKNNASQKEPTILLITKIIMATMGCVPSYDRYFKDGLKKIKKEKLGNFTKDSFKNLLNFSKRDKELKKVYKEAYSLKRRSLKHSPMKLLDLYFWLLGSQGKTS